MSMSGPTFMSTDAHPNLPQSGYGAVVPQGSSYQAGTDASDNPTTVQPPSVLGKRKAETQDNERLSKRLSLLNLERNGHKLYVPVETPSNLTSATQTATQPTAPDDSMQLDDSKHKVYIYNLDDELSSESEDEEGKLVFLPNIEKHLRDNRIPPHILANSDGELAGMQLVLYSDPRSLSVPEEKDGVRKAIIDSRQRAREKQRLECEGVATTNNTTLPPTCDDDDEMDID
ncbi:hypothetical protein QQS21_009086 [Conoideocrella luteorostrata]|uniref:Uncharacterized protein n=1 Tax=Conoideocrella luteorostrata TaxID=1105319 RepID=A0AAJ0CHR6_9HYPO|nr:hypothetical protein QQS21_009086 [Conoideocrella luteorostrata]